MSQIEPLYLPLELRENVQFRDTLEFSDDSGVLDLTGATLTCQIRASASLTSELLHTVALTVDIPTGAVTRRIPQSVCFSLKSKPAYHDLKIVWSNGDEDILVEGPVSVKAGPTI